MMRLHGSDASDYLLSWLAEAVVDSSDGDGLLFHLGVNAATTVPAVLHGGGGADRFLLQSSTGIGYGLSTGHLISANFLRGQDRIELDEESSGPIAASSHLAWLDRDGDGVLTAADARIRIEPVALDGRTQLSTVIDMNDLALPEAPVSGDHRLVLHGVTGLPAADFGGLAVGLDRFGEPFLDLNGNGGADDNTIVAPLVRAPVALRLAEDGAPAALDLARHFWSWDGSPLAFEILGESALGTLDLAAGTLRFTPAADAFGEETLRLLARTGAGASITTELVIEVAPVNDAPVAVADAAAVRAGRKVVVNALANDYDVDGDRLAIVALTAPIQGQVELLANGRLRYHANSDAHGVDSFDYTVSDGMGGIAVGSVYVAIAGAPKPPVAPVQPAGPLALDDVFSGTVRQLAKGLKLDPLGNDRHPAGPNWLDRASLTVEEGPALGSLALRKGKLVYAAGHSFDGADSFTYSVADKSGMRSELATVTVLGPGLALDALVAVGEPGGER